MGAEEHTPGSLLSCANTHHPFSYQQPGACYTELRVSSRVFTLSCVLKDVFYLQGSRVVHYSFPFKHEQSTELACPAWDCLRLSVCLGCFVSFFFTAVEK